MSASIAPIRLSPSTIGLFQECPRCFWLHINKRIHRPSGPFPSLPGGIDIVLKKYFDRYRGTSTGLPPELEGKVSGKLFGDTALLKQWRNWRTGLRYEDATLNASLSGALDDCLIEEDGRYTPLDYKTRGSAPNESSSGYYRHQIDIYALLLAENGYEPSGSGCLAYYFPEEVEDRGRIRFGVAVKALETRPERAQAVFSAAVKTLRGALPQHHSACEYCSWGRYDIAEDEE